MCEMWKVLIFHCVSMHTYFQYFLWLYHCLIKLLQHCWGYNWSFLFFMIPICVKESRLLSVFTQRITTFSAPGSKRKTLLHLLFARCSSPLRSKEINIPTAVFSSNQQVPSSHKPPPLHPLYPLSQHRKLLIVIMQRGRKIFLHSCAIYFSKCRSELLLNYSWKV